MAPHPAEPIDSPRNSRIVAARALLTRKGRGAAGAFLVEGPHAVAAVVDAGGFEIRDVFVTQAAAAREVELLRRLARDGVAVHTVTDRALRAIGDTVTPQGVVAVAARRHDEPPQLPRAPRLVAVLDGCSDPGNAGTAIRTAVAAGADAVVMGPGSVDIWSGKCIRASAGSVFQIPVLTEPSSARAVAELRSAGCQVLATAVDGDVDLDTVADTGGLAGPTAWVFGNEAHGLPSELRAAVDRTVRVPLYGPVESLNLAACVAVCLYASAREQHRRER